MDAPVERLAATGVAVETGLEVPLGAADVGVDARLEGNDAEAADADATGACQPEEGDVDAAGGRGCALVR